MKNLLTAVTICSLATGLCISPAMAQMKAPNHIQGQLVRTSNVIGADLHNQKGDDIGQINDLIFDENTGGDTHAILAAGDYLGIGDKLTPVKWNEIHVQVNNDDNPKVITDLDKAKLSSMKSYDQDAWNNDGAAALQKMPATDHEKLVRASKVNDAKLFDTDAHQIGEIKDVVMDAKSGKAAYAVVKFEDSYINKGDQMTMVPWKLIRQSKKATPGYVLHADKSKIEGAKFFESNAWPDLHDVTWSKHVYDYYAVTPYYWQG